MTEALTIMHAIQCTGGREPYETLKNVLHGEITGDIIRHSDSDITNISVFVKT